MRTVTTVSAFLLAGLLVIGAMAAAPDEEPAEAKPTAHRLKGMKAAISDLEKGVLKQKEYPPLPYPPHYPKFIRLLEAECNVEWEVVKGPAASKELREEVGGYNDVMRAEIEHRFGRDLFDKLQIQAKES